MNEGDEKTVMFTKVIVRIWGLSCITYSHEQPQEVWFIFYQYKIGVHLENLHSVFIIDSLSVGKISNELLPGFFL